MWRGASSVGPAWKQVAATSFANLERTADLVPVTARASLAWIAWTSHAQTAQPNAPLQNVGKECVEEIAETARQKVRGATQGNAGSNASPIAIRWNVVMTVVVDLVGNARLCRCAATVPASASRRVRE